MSDLECAAMFFLGAIFGWMVLPIPFELWLCFWMILCTVSLLLLRLKAHRKRRPNSPRKRTWNARPRVTPADPVEVVKAIRGRYAPGSRGKPALPTLPVHRTPPLLRG